MRNHFGCLSLTTYDPSRLHARYGSNTGGSRRPSYWRRTLAIACSPLDAGQTDVIIDSHDRL